MGRESGSGLCKPYTACAASRAAAKGPISGGEPKERPQSRKLKRYKYGRSGPEGPMLGSHAARWLGFQLGLFLQRYGCSPYGSPAGRQRFALRRGLPIRGPVATTLAGWLQGSSRVRRLSNKLAQKSASRRTIQTTSLARRSPFRVKCQAIVGRGKRGHIFWQPTVWGSCAPTGGRRRQNAQPYESRMRLQFGAEPNHSAKALPQGKIMVRRSQCQGTNLGMQPSSARTCALAAASACSAPILALSAPLLGPALRACLATLGQGMRAAGQPWPSLAERSEAKG